MAATWLPWLSYSHSRQVFVIGFSPLSVIALSSDDKEDVRLCIGKIAKAGEGFVNQESSFYSGGNVVCTVFKIGTKVIVNDNNGNTIDELETRPKEVEPVEVVEKPEVKKKGKKKSSDS